ncbi:MAG: hypothetical protein Q4F28_13495 [Eubacteriales bacterium]|nr:hypothetical protein [Eubacteriales bacterium]
MAKSLKIVQNHGKWPGFRLENLKYRAVWTIKANFRGNCPKIWGFWIITP